MAKIELKEKLAAVDLGAKDLWDDMDDDQRKALKQEFFILNRYISNVKGQNRDKQEHFVLTVNEYFNKHWNLLQKHPKLMWQLLCLCSYDKKQIFFHEWIGHKKKTGDTKKVKLLQELYPNAKMDELEVMAVITPSKDLKKMAQDQCWDDKKIDKYF